MIPSVRKRRLLFSLLRGGLALGLVGLAITLGKGAYNMYGIMQQSRAEAHEARNRYQELADRQERAERALQELATPYGQEAVLRERFGVAAKGEVVIVLTDAPVTEATSTEAAEEEGFFSGLFHAIGF
jgi:hypothetical protein